MKINPEFKDLLPPLSDKEYSLLEENITRDGCREPLTLWNDTLIDGHHRYKICTEYDVQFTTVQMDFETVSHARVWMVHNQKGRRTPSEWVQYEMEQLIKDDLLKIGKEISKESGELKKGMSTIDKPSHNTRNAIANKLGWSTGKVAMADKVKAIAQPEVIDLINTGEITINKAYQDIRKAEIKAANDKLKAETPEPVFNGKYDVLVLDPPWPMKKIEREVAPNQHAFDYPTMSEEEMTEMELPFNDNSHVFMWTTQKFLPMALRMFEAWDVKYVLTMVWHKPGGFQPFNLPQYNCEFVLYGRVGSPKFIDTKAFNTCFNAPRGSHSEKPEEFYETLRRVTDGNRIDIFNRRKIEGFATWGNESE